MKNLPEPRRYNQQVSVRTLSCVFSRILWRWNSKKQLVYSPGDVPRRGNGFAFLKCFAHSIYDNYYYCAPISPRMRAIIKIFFVASLPVAGHHQPARAFSRPFQPGNQRPRVMSRGEPAACFQYSSEKVPNVSKPTDIDRNQTFTSGHHPSREPLPITTTLPGKPPSTPPRRSLSSPRAPSN